MSTPSVSSPDGSSSGPAAEAPLYTQAPLFTVVTGSPTPEELAALTAVVVGLQAEGSDAGNEPDRTARQRAWGRRELARKRLVPGYGAWKRGAH